MTTRDSESLDIPPPPLLGDGFVLAGQFKGTFSGLQELMHVIDVDAVEVAENFDAPKVDTVARVRDVLYVTVLNSLEEKLASRQSARQELLESASPCPPMAFIKMSAADFASLAGYQKVRPRSEFGEEFLKTICR